MSSNIAQLGSSNIIFDPRTNAQSGSGVRRNNSLQLGEAKF